MAGEANAGGGGNRPEELLPLAQEREVGAGLAGAAGEAGAAVRGLAPGERSGDCLRLEASGAAAPRVGLADGGRGGGVPESVDGVPNSQGSEAGLSVASAEQAVAEGAGQGDAPGPDLGDGLDVPD